jgi:hypothetical protein
MTADEARDEILAIFKAVWAPTGYHTVWDDTPGEPPEVDANSTWARVTVQHIDAQQSSLGDATSKKRFSNKGIVTVQIFTPAGDGHAAGYVLGQQVLNAYRDPSNGSVWYRNQTLRELPRSGAFSQINVSANFIYDDVR